jgi:hypothetical protein
MSVTGNKHTALQKQSGNKQPLKEIHYPADPENEAAHLIVGPWDPRSYLDMVKQVALDPQAR